MNTATIIAIFSTLITAPLLTSLISWRRDRKKDHLTEDSIRVDVLQKIINTHMVEMERLHSRIKELETEIDTLYRRIKDK